MCKKVGSLTKLVLIDVEKSTTESKWFENMVEWWKYTYEGVKHKGK